MKFLSIKLLILSVIFVACRPVDLSSAPSITIQWTTGTEIDTAGFNLYRSESAEGSYIKVNVELIPASLDPVAGGQYQFTDQSVQAGKTYYYQLEDVEYNGTVTRHGPIVATASSDLALLGGIALLAILLAGGLTSWFFRSRTHQIQR